MNVFLSHPNLKDCNIFGFANSRRIEDIELKNKSEAHGRYLLSILPSYGQYYGSDVTG